MQRQILPLRVRVETHCTRNAIVGYSICGKDGDTLFEFREWNSHGSQNRVATSKANPPFATPTKDWSPQFRNGTSLKNTKSKEGWAAQPTCLLREHLTLEEVPRACPRKPGVFNSGASSKKLSVPTKLFQIRSDQLVAFGWTFRNRNLSISDFVENRPGIVSHTKLILLVHHNAFRAPNGRRPRVVHEVE